MAPIEGGQSLAEAKPFHITNLIFVRTSVNSG
jgi:hypothetical protein